MYKIELSFWKIEKECKAPIGDGTWCGSAKSLDSAIKLATCHTLAMFEMKYKQTSTLWTKVVNALEIPAKRNLCAFCLRRNSCTSLQKILQDNIDPEHAHIISACDDHIKGAQISVHMYEQKADVETTVDVDLGVSDEDNNLCALCASKNTCSVLQDLRKRGISLQDAHISECNQFICIQTGNLMRCKYCGTLQDEPQGAKICVQCGGAI